MSILSIANTVMQSAEWKRYSTRFGADLRGMCAIASAILFTHLVREGVQAMICGNNRHCWVRLEHEGEWFDLDLTAKQFGYRHAILFCKAGTALDTVGRDLIRDYYAGSWEQDSMFTSVQDLCDWQEERGWPSKQIALL